MTLSISFPVFCLLILFQQKKNEHNHTSETCLNLSKNILVNQLPFACPLLFYKDQSWAHSFLLYIIMTHHLFVLETEIQMHVADSVIYSHGPAEAQVSAKCTNSMVHLTPWLSCMFLTKTNRSFGAPDAFFYKEKRYQYFYSNPTEGS